MLSKIIVIGALLSPIFALADSGESKSFQFLGQHSVAVDLRGELSHTEYRQETYPDTCYRSVLDHYETRCTNEPITVCNSIEPNSVNLSSAVTEDLRPGPGGGGGGPGDGNRPPPYHPPGGGGGGGGDDHGGHGGGGGDDHGGHGGGGGGGGPQCHTEYRQRCSQEPVYIDQPYTCYQTRQVPYTVKDGDTLNHVTVNFGEIPTGVALNDNFILSSSGRALSVNVQGSNQVLYRLSQQQTETNNGGLVEINTLVNVQLESAVAINSAVSAGLTSLTTDTNTISFIVGKVVHPELIVTNLKVEHEHWYGNSKLIDRDLLPSEITLTDLGDKTRVDVKTSAVGLDLGGKKVKVRAKIRLNVQSGYANPQAVSTAQPEQTIEVKL